MLLAVRWAVPVPNRILPGRDEDDGDGGGGGGDNDDVCSTSLSAPTGCVGCAMSEYYQIRTKMVVVVVVVMMMCLCVCSTLLSAPTRWVGCASAKQNSSR